MQEKAQAKRSREWIQGALVELMKKKEYESITIKDITDKAGVARLTFYRHYQSKEEVLEDYFAQQFSRYLETFQNSNDQQMIDALSLCFDYWKKGSLMISLLKKAGLDKILYGHFGSYLEMMLDRYDNDFQMSDLQRQFLVGGLYFAMLEYVLSDDSTSPYQAARSVLSLLDLNS